MTVQHSQQFEGLVVDKLPQPDALVPRARREQRRGRVPGAACVRRAFDAIDAMSTRRRVDGVEGGAIELEVQKR